MHEHSTEMRELMQRLKLLPNNGGLRSLLSTKGLAIMNVAWEDNARKTNSSVGPCISDLTLLVANEPQPIVRPPNFSDVTFDIPTSTVPVVVNNDRGGELASIPLSTLLANIGTYCNNLPPGTNLHAPHRDSHVVVSAQNCFLPVLKEDLVPFTVSLYNYQSRPDDPCVLVLICTSKGTSAQIVDSSTGYRGQKLYFNQNGSKCVFEAQRLKDNRRERGVALEGAMSKQEKQDNIIMVIQIPLRQRNPATNSNVFGASFATFGGAAPGAANTQEKTKYSSFSFGASAAANDAFNPSSNFSFEAAAMPSAMMAPQMMPMQASMSSCRMRAVSPPSTLSNEADVEDVIVRLGAPEGQFPKYHHLKFERDDRFPVRVTLQFYKGTGTGVISNVHVEAVAAQLNEAKSRADFCGSLVTEPSAHRPTNPALFTPATPLSGSHPNVNCDQCNQPLTTQLRFKCLICPDFDLCANCEANQSVVHFNGVHTSKHLLIAIRNSTQMPNSILTSNRNNLQHAAHCTSCHKSPIVGIRYRCTQCTADLCEACELLSPHAATMHTTLKIMHPEQTQPKPAFGFF